MNPSAIASRRSTARNGGEPRSRTVVNPASSVVLAFTTAAKPLLNGVFLNLSISPNESAREPRCVWQSIRPGRTVAPDRSITSARSGTVTSDGPPTALIRPPSVTITRSARDSSPVPSNSRPARMHTTFGAAGVSSDPCAAPANVGSIRARMTVGRFK